MSMNNFSGTGLWSAHRSNAGTARGVFLDGSQGKIYRPLSVPEPGITAFP